MSYGSAAFVTPRTIFAPRPHGPELWALSSTESDFDGLSSFRRPRQRIQARFSRQGRLNCYMKCYMEGVCPQDYPDAETRVQAVPRYSADLNPA